MMLQHGNRFVLLIMMSSDLCKAITAVTPRSQRWLPRTGRLKFLTTKRHSLQTFLKVRSVPPCCYVCDGENWFLGRKAHPSDVFDPSQQQLTGRKEQFARSRINLKSGERAHTFGGGSWSRYETTIEVLLILILC